MRRIGLAMFSSYRGAVVLTAGLIVGLFAAARGARSPEAAPMPSHLERSRDPYFCAFLARCMDYVYGQDPRHHTEDRRAQ